MPGLNRLVVPVTAGGLSILAVYLTWPNSQMIAPEKTGEIGFMGIVVIAKYFGYGTRIMGSITLGAATFFAVTVCGRWLKTVFTEPQP